MFKVLVVAFLLPCYVAALICLECDGIRIIENISIILDHTQNFCSSYEDFGKPVNCVTSCFRHINYEYGNKVLCVEREE